MVILIVRRTKLEIWRSLLSDINERLSHTLAIEYLEEQEDSPDWGRR